MTAIATLDTNNILTIDGKKVGQIMAVMSNGTAQNPTGSRGQVKTQFRPIINGSLGNVVAIDLPVYLHRSPSDHYINPALIDAVVNLA